MFKQRFLSVIWRCGVFKVGLASFHIENELTGEKI